MRHLYNTTVEIQRKENVGTEFHPVWDWDIHLTPQVRISQLSSARVIRDEGGVIKADHEMYLDPCDIKITDRIVTTTAIYEIYSIDDIDGMGHHYEVKMKKLDNSMSEAGS
jgi:hypothetical protein